MERGEDGYHVARLPVGGGARYLFRFPDGRERPDPASRFQPEGVHGPSEVVASDFRWTDAGWRGLPLRDYVIYELHVGTFSREGTFDGVIAELDRLRQLGITAVEIMPVSPFPGERNWGYDGVYPHGVQSSYGGPEGLKRLVDSCHARGMAAILDVVYNHLGPEGNYLGEFAPFFTDRYKTAWGLALNFDGPGSDHVREYFVQSALQWIDEFHFDGLRLDAVHAIVDPTARPFLAEVSDAVHARAKELGRAVALIAESDLNDPRMISPTSASGFGYDAQWADDFHHCLHRLLTGESSGYYGDYRSVEDLAEIYRKGWLFSGQYSPYRGRRYGAPPPGSDGSKFIVCLQNHDQIGNRMQGDRLAATLSLEQQTLGLGLVLTSPFTPMLFMGEEYGETSPFLYFVSHTDAGLAEAVRNGRREEFAAFAWSGEVPDPMAEETFSASKLHPAAAPHADMLQRFVRELLRLRREHPLLRSRSLEGTDARATEGLLTVRRNGLLLIANFQEKAAEVAPTPAGERWRKLLATCDRSWNGPVDAPESIGEGIAVKVPAHTLFLYEARS
jgi:maltooligosyltrehalose trehalohydrolase